MNLDRQGFLGSESVTTITAARAGIVGLCGGGSHVAQQLAHIGVGTIKLIDHDCADETNLNRMVGLTQADVDTGAQKTDVLGRVVKAINPKVCVEPYPMRWQTCAQSLRECTVLFGCVDSFVERDQLESFARRFMIPYIDIGMDVHGEVNEHFITGQVILSLPGHACMRCMGFLTDTVLNKEARRYGQAGGKPQVVWPNGTLASIAVGQFMSLLTPWNLALQPELYLEFDGNRSVVTPSKRLIHIAQERCPHFEGPNTLGDVHY